MIFILFHTFTMYSLFRSDGGFGRIIIFQFSAKGFRLWLLLSHVAAGPPKSWIFLISVIPGTVLSTNDRDVQVEKDLDRFEHLDRKALILTINGSPCLSRTTQDPSIIRLKVGSFASS